jgi:hypothetical protein
VSAGVAVGQVQTGVGGSCAVQAEGTVCQDVRAAREGTSSAGAGVQGTLQRLGKEARRQDSLSKALPARRGDYI